MLHFSWHVIKGINEHGYNSVNINYYQKVYRNFVLQDRVFGYAHVPFQRKFSHLNFQPQGLSENIYGTSQMQS